VWRKKGGRAEGGGEKKGKVSVGNIQDPREREARFLWWMIEGRIGLQGAQISVMSVRYKQETPPPPRRIIVRWPQKTKI